MKIKRLLLCGLILGAAALATFLLLPPGTPLSPLGGYQESRTSNLDSSSYVVLGFAPYWNLKKITPQSAESITHFAYFALHLDEQGGIYTHVNRREQEPGYTNYQRLLSKTIPVPNKPLILTFMPIDQDALSGALATPTTRTTTVRSMVQALAESGAQGVNVDFEPLGDISADERNRFTLFIQELREALAHTNSSQLSISIYASSASRPRLWDLAALQPLTDYFVVMTYDYTMPRSTTAGPNSPLRDAGSNFEHNIVKNIAEISEVVPTRKILLGIPFYGYEWDTVDSAKYSPTEGRGSVASLERIDEMIADKTLELVWDRNTLTPYGVASESGQTSQIYFENETSIRLKLDFVKTANLGGIAIWALGYEGSNSTIWNTINSALHSRP